MMQLKLRRSFVQAITDTACSEVLCTLGGQPNELVQSSSENDIGFALRKGTFVQRPLPCLTPS
jgi:hypothetical protein